MHKSFALFDFDGTVIPGDSIVRFCFFAYKKDICSRKQLWKAAWAALRYLLGIITADQSKMISLAFLIGKSQEELTALSQEFYTVVLQPLLRRQAVEALAKHRAQGATILLVTASPSFYMEPFKEAYGIEAVIGTRMDMSPAGTLTGHICGESCKGLQKPLRLAEYLAATGDRLDYENSYAYGDSPSDFPMLALCGHKVAVNARPKLKRKLGKAEGAQFEHWEDQSGGSKHGGQFFSCRRNSQPGH